MDKKITGIKGNWFSEVNPEEIQMVNTMLDHLLAQAKLDISNFQAHVNRIDNDDYDDYEDIEELSDVAKEIRKYKCLKEYSVHWEPRGKVEEFSHVRYVKLEYTPITGRIIIKSHIHINTGVPGMRHDDESYSAVYDIGFVNSESILAIRKKFHTIYKMSNEYWSVEVPKMRHEEATNHFCRLFPKIVDDILLSELPDEQEGNN